MQGVSLVRNPRPIHIYIYIYIHVVFLKSFLLYRILLKIFLQIKCTINMGIEQITSIKWLTIKWYLIIYVQN